MAKFGKYDLELVPDDSLSGSLTNQRITPTTPDQLGEMLEYNLHFAQDKARNLYVFEDGAYRLVGNSIYVACMAFYKTFGQKWNTNKDNQVMDFLLKRAPEMLEQPLPDRINMRNGLYFIYEDRFEPHSEVDHSDYRTLIQIPIDYDPNATCPRVDTFLRDIFPEGYQLLYDVIGICMTSVTSQHMAVILLGGGCNGKSVFLHGLRSLIGFDNVSTTPMHTLADSKDRFANSDLVHKLVNAGDDTMMEKILETANIKSIISGNPIRSEGKFRDAVTYKPFCKLVFASNHRLEANDDTLGYSRRIMHIPLTRTFAKNPEVETRLLAMFEDPTERSGVFNEVVKRLRVTCTRGFQIPDEAEELVNNYDPIPHDAEEFLNTVLVEDVNSKVPCREFYVTYLLETERDESERRLAKYITQLFPLAKRSRPRINGVQIPHYMNVKVVGDNIERIMKTVLPEISYLDNNEESNP